MVKIKSNSQPNGSIYLKGSFLLAKFSRPRARSPQCISAGQTHRRTPLPLHKIHLCRLFPVNRRRDQGQIMQPKCIISVLTIQRGTAKVYTFLMTFNQLQKNTYTPNFFLICLVLRRCLSQSKQWLRDIQHVANSTSTFFLLAHDSQQEH